MRVFPKLPGFVAWIHRSSILHDRLVSVLRFRFWRLRCFSMNVVTFLKTPPPPPFTMINLKICSESRSGKMRTKMENFPQKIVSIRQCTFFFVRIIVNGGRGVNHPAMVVFFSKKKVTTSLRNTEGKILEHQHFLLFFYVCKNYRTRECIMWTYHCKWGEGGKAPLNSRFRSADIGVM